MNRWVYVKKVPGAGIIERRYVVTRKPGLLPMVEIAAETLHELMLAAGWERAEVERDGNL